MVLQEVYIGRIPEVEEIFKEFSELRSTYKKFNSKNTAIRTAKIEKLIEDLWGFKAFSLEIIPTDEPNAFTYPVASSIDIDPDDYIITGKTGYKFDKKAGIVALSKITSGLFTNPNISDEECFAVFLHEIGHSFVHRSPYLAAQQDLYRSVVLTQIIMNIIIGIITFSPNKIKSGVEDALMQTNAYKKFLVELTKAKKKTPILRNISDIYDNTKGTVQGIIGNAMYFILTGTGVSLAINKSAKATYNKVSKKKIKKSGNPNAYSRSAERLSDDFATMYGFGPYLSSALIKIESPDNQGKFMDKIHTSSKISDLANKTDAIAMEVNGLLGAHPSSADRILAILESMEKDLSSDKSMPDKVKKELKENIRQTKAVIKDIKSDQGKIKNKNEYMQALTVLGLNNGNTEDFVEKKYTDRKQLKKFYDSRKERKEAAFIEQAENDIILMNLEDYF